VEFKHADPRELILKAAHRLEAELQLVARLLGQLTASRSPWGIHHRQRPRCLPEWVATRTAILNALAPYPEARRCRC
jgi:hypothetical protein